MSLVSFLHHNTFRLHENPAMHPESPNRLGAIDQAVSQSGLAKNLISITPRMASESELCLVHSPSYIEDIEKAAQIAQKQNKLIQLDSDTFLSPSTLDAAKLAVGASFDAIESLGKDNISNAFVAVRPPGHHALAQRQMGFCIFNNIAMAACYARKYLGCKKVLIIDWDVHHGNGTQDIFYNDPDVFFISLHQYPWWPYETGWYTEDGQSDGKGYNLNIPLPGGTGDSGYLEAWDRLILPLSLEYKPDIILVSAGYDAHKDDPMGGQRISTTGFAMLTSRLKELANTLNIKTAYFLEGGYNVAALAQSVLGTLNVLTADDQLDLEPETDNQSPQELEERLSAITKHFNQYWKNLK